MSVESANQILSKLWQEIEQTRMQAATEQAKADPEKHKLSTVLEPGVRAGTYSYYDCGRDGHKAKIRWCWHGPNVAGYWLCWREKVTGKKLTRTEWSAWKKRERAETEALRRYNREGK
jgi:hypothetical protein